MEPHNKVMDGDEDDDGEEEEELECPSLSSSSDSTYDDDDDDDDDTTSPLPPPLSSSSPLFGMSTLMEQLPIKRGLSRHFVGKSQSFTSLSKVKCLEDLAKPCRRRKVVKPCRRRCGGGGGGLDVRRHRSTIAKKNTDKHGSLSYLGDLKRRNATLEGRKAMHELGSGSLANGTLLYA